MEFNDMPVSTRLRQDKSFHCTGDDQAGMASTMNMATTNVDIASRATRMRRVFIQEPCGDSSRVAIDIYYHIDLKELKEAYLACIPQLGI